MRKPRLVTLMSCQWADMDLDTLCSKAAQMGYDGIELATWGNHLDPIRAAQDDAYVEEIKAIFQRHGLVVKALCSHVPSQCVQQPGWHHWHGERQRHELPGNRGCCVCDL